MISQVRPWLLPGALTGRAISTWLDGIIAEWSRQWFVSHVHSAGRVMPLAEVRALRDGAAREEDIWGATQAVCTRTSTHGRQLLVRQALAVSASDIPAAGDEVILGAFAREMIESFLEKVETALGITAGRSGETIAATIAVRDADERDVMSLRLTAAACRALLDQALGKAETQPIPDGRIAALMGNGVQLEARAGAATLGLQALGTLAVGDVIVLDRMVEHGVEIGVVGGRSFASAELIMGANEAEAHILHRS